MAYRIKIRKDNGQWTYARKHGSSGEPCSFANMERVRQYVRNHPGVFTDKEYKIVPEGKDAPTS